MSASLTVQPYGTPAIRIAGRDLRPSAVFDTYWQFAAERQAIYESRLAGEHPPWTRDRILAAHRFTNCYRAADRVSQYLITQVSYQGDQSWEEVFFRTILFKIFNRISAWQLLSARLDQVSWAEYDFARYDKILSEALDLGHKLYSAAYIVPPPPLGETRKHRNHLRLVELMMRDNAPVKVATSSSMAAAFSVLARYPGIGRFLAYQYLIDLNYAARLGFSEMEFVMAGPGARDGLRKCFGPGAAGIEAELIRFMADTQEEQFARRGLRFRGLRGRPLQLIDCQNLFCEVDKYARVAHPEVAGISGRTRIKQAYRHDAAPLTAWFPPKWDLNDPNPPPIAESAGFAAVHAYPLVSRCRGQAGRGQVALFELG